MAKEIDIEGLDTLSEAMQDFTAALKSSNKSPLTIQSYEEAVTYFEKFHVAANRPNKIGAIERSDVEAFIIDQLDRFKVSTAGVRFRSLRAFFNWLVQTGHIDKSPMSGMKEPRGQAPLIEIVPIEEMRALLEATSGKTFDDYRDNAILRLFYDTGARLDEITRLNIGDIDRTAKTMIVLGKGNNTGSSLSA